MSRRDRLFGVSAREYYNLPELSLRHNMRLLSQWLSQEEPIKLHRYVNSVREEFSVELDLTFAEAFRSDID